MWKSELMLKHMSPGDSSEMSENAILLPVRQSTTIGPETTSRSHLPDSTKEYLLTDVAPPLKQTRKSNCSNTVIKMIALNLDKNLEDKEWFKHYTENGGANAFAPNEAQFSRDAVSEFNAHAHGHLDWKLDVTRLVVEPATSGKGEVSDAERKEFEENLNEAIRKIKTHINERHTHHFVLLLKGEFGNHFVLIGKIASVNANSEKIESIVLRDPLAPFAIQIPLQDLRPNILAVYEVTSKAIA